MKKTKAIIKEELPYRTRKLFSNVNRGNFGYSKFKVYYQKDLKEWVIKKGFWDGGFLTSSELDALAKKLDEYNKELEK